jgi:hypothetical protein
VVDDDGVALLLDGFAPDGVIAHQSPPDAFRPFPLVMPAELSAAYV